MIFYEKKECRHPPASLFTKLKTKLKFMMDYEFYKVYKSAIETGATVLAMLTFCD